MTNEEDDEIEFPEDMISFLKIKLPKSHTDHEKQVLKQLQYLADERKELKDVVNKKRDEAKIKTSSLLSSVSSEEAKEKAIKLVQEGAIHLKSKGKTTDLSDFSTDLDNSNLQLHSDQKPFRREVSTPTHSSSPVESSKTICKSRYLSSRSISFVSGGVEFNGSIEENADLKRSLSVVGKEDSEDGDESGRNQEPSSKRSRVGDESGSDEETADGVDTWGRKIDSNSSKTCLLRFCGYNMTEEFVRRQVEPIASIESLEMERSHHNTVNIIIKLETPETASRVHEKLDTKYLDGRLLSVYFKKEAFPKRKFNRRRRRQDNVRGRGGRSFPGFLDSSGRGPPQSPLFMGQQQHQDDIGISGCMTPATASEVGGDLLPSHFYSDRGTSGSTTAPSPPSSPVPALASVVLVDKSAVNDSNQDQLDSTANARDLVCYDDIII